MNLDRLKNSYIKLKIKIHNKYNFKQKFFIKLRRIESINKKITSYKNEFLGFCYDKNFEKELLKIENTEFKTIENLIKSKEMNLDKLYGDNFLELQKKYAHETWYLKDKNDINQFKVEEDIIKHGSYEQQLLLIKTRPYGYIKETIRDFNLLNWRGYGNYHFIDFYGDKMKKFEKLLWKKLLSLSFKEMIKTIFYFGFPGEWSSQIMNNDGAKYIK